MKALLRGGPLDGHSMDLKGSPLPCRMELWYMGRNFAEAHLPAKPMDSFPPGSAVAVYQAAGWNHRGMVYDWRAKG